MRFLIASVGSNGDLHPYVGVGMALAARGHRVGFLTQPYFERMVREAGLEYFPVGEMFDMAELAKRPEMMASWAGTMRILRDHIIPHTGTFARTIEPLIGSFRPDAIFAHHLCFGLPWTAQRAGIPYALGLLSPIMFLSRQDPSVFTPLGRDPRPGWRYNLFIRLAILVNRFLYDRPLNRFRRELGFEPGRDWFTRDVKEAPAILGLWSRHFRPPMPDDPAHGVVCGFPWYDRHKQQEHAPDQVSRFLDSGDPPITFTLGSTAVHVAGPFYKAAADACRILGRRGMLLTGRPEYAPEAFPPGVAAFTYAPYGQVLPRGCATVHHGGIGTTAQGLRSGKPTVIVPFAHDQFDNASRVRRLGTSVTVARNRISGPNLAAALRRVLEDPAIRDRASQVGAQVAAEDGAEVAANRLIALAGG